MSGVLAFVGQRRKALGYILAALAEYVTNLIPQANPGNAQILHGIILALGFALVYFPANDAAGSAGVSEFIDSLVAGDPKHAAPPPVPIPAYVPPSVPDAPAAPSLQG